MKNQPRDVFFWVASLHQVLFVALCSFHDIDIPGMRYMNVNLAMFVQSRPIDEFMEDFEQQEKVFKEEIAQAKERNAGKKVRFCVSKHFSARCVSKRIACILPIVPLFVALGPSNTQLASMSELSHPLPPLLLNTYLKQSLAGIVSRTQRKLGSYNLIIPIRFPHCNNLIACEGGSSVGSRPGAHEPPARGRTREQRRR